MYYLCSENNGADLLPVTSQLICAYVFTYAKSRFSHDVAYIVLYKKFFNDLSDICSMFAVQCAVTDNVNILAESGCFCTVTAKFCAPNSYQYVAKTCYVSDVRSCLKFLPKMKY